MPLQAGRVAFRQMRIRRQHGERVRRRDEAPLPMMRLRSPSPSEAAPKSGATSLIVRSYNALAWTRFGSG